MADADTDLAELSKSVESIKDDLSDLQDLKSKLNDVLDAQEPPEQELQGDGEMEQVAQLIEQFNADHDLDDPTVADFVSWAQEADADTETIEDVVSVFMQESEAELPDEAALADLAAFIEAQAGGGDEEPEEEENAEMAALEDTVRELEARLDDIAEQPTPPKVGTPEEPGEADTRPVGPLRAGLVRDGDYISR